MRLKDAFEVFGLTRHQYYHRPKSGREASGAAPRAGRAASTHTLHHDRCGQVQERPNEGVVNRIRAIQRDDDLRCGYKRMSAQLQLEGYQINHKKVYRLMRKNALLLSRARKVERTYVTQRRACPAEPLTLLEMDIKMIWIEEHSRYAYILTILDTFTRQTLFWQQGYRMKWQDVKRAWEWVIEHHLQAAQTLARGLHIEIRSDNGPQFLAKRLQEFFLTNHLVQVFTHPYTPQENGHVESFHSILSTALAHERFWTLEQLEARLLTFYDKYNNERVHSAIAYLPPNVFLLAWEQKLIEMTQEKGKKATFRLKVPRYQLSGLLKPKGASRSAEGGLNALPKQQLSSTA